MVDGILPEAAGDEQWRSIPSLPGYEASSLGRIRSLDRVRGFQGRWGWTERRHRGRILRLKVKSNGTSEYRCFYADGETYPQVNRAVCEAFHGPAPSPDHEAAHLDGNSLNDRASNLTWATAIENAAHKEQHGTAPRGSRNGVARLVEADVTAIFCAYAAGESGEAVAARLGVSRGTVIAVIRRKNWKHVAVDPAVVAAAQTVARNNIAEARNRANAERRRQAMGCGRRRAVADRQTGAIREEFQDAFASPS